MQEILKRLGAKKGSKESIKDTKGIAQFALAPKIPESQLAEYEEQAQQAQSAGDQVPVIVDGIPMFMFRGVVQGLVRIGAFIVVWPGTEIHVGYGESENGYPPDWIGPYIPK
ncbi:hypothetical protein [Jannaschia pohangensis]|uniref:Uncharacterized protein n=1 Tax=Jannaschia pohangensis TaxID=390807 RepID=A0A1I3GFW9_9RHOB|nr:hypothetical protein [Jannaschia pohangensis]SFI22386.1 hypothetical protein SAMN04488095_0182 [Jannaschia pohangensis]